MAFNNLAKLYAHQGKYAEAQGLCQRALDTLENIFDRDHPNMADVLETMAQLHDETGNQAEALKLWQRVEEIRSHKQVAHTPIAKVIE